MVKVSAVTNLLGWLSGLLLVAPQLRDEPTVLAATAIAMQITYGITLHFFAAMTGRDRRLWGLAGLFGGIPAVAVLLLLMETSPD